MQKSSFTDEERKQIRRRRYERQLTEGCGNENCKNINCASSSLFTKFDHDELESRISDILDEQKFCPLDYWAKKVNSLSQFQDVIDFSCEEHKFAPISTMINELFGKVSSLSSAFLEEQKPLEPELHTLRDATDCPQPILDLSPSPSLIKHIYDTLHRANSEFSELDELLESTLLRLSADIDQVKSEVQKSMQALRVIPFLLLQRGLVLELKDNIIENVTGCIMSIDPTAQNVLRSWFARWKKRDVLKVVRSLESYVTLEVMAKSVDAILMSDVCGVLQMFVDANRFVSNLPFSSHLALDDDVFYNVAVNSLVLEWEVNRLLRGQFSFTLFPFLFDAQRKGELLRLETRQKRAKKYRSAMLNRLLTGRGSPFFRLFLRRDHMLEDALVALDNVEVSELKKPLKVCFEGEEGIDEGGVMKEFFVVITRDLFNPEYGMFTTEKPDGNDDEDDDKASSSSRGSGGSRGNKLQVEDSEGANGLKMEAESGDESKTASGKDSLGDKSFIETLTQRIETETKKEKDKKESRMEKESEPEEKEAVASSSSVSSETAEKIAEMKSILNPAGSENIRKDKQPSGGDDIKSNSESIGKYSSSSAAAASSSSSSLSTDSIPSVFHWFAPFFRDDVREYRFIGVLMGLAIYNDVILDVHFPLAVYRKLLGQKPTLSDLAEIRPSVAHSLQLMLEMEDASTLGMTFCATRKLFGSVETIELCEGGAEKEITNENRDEYVRLYLKWFFEDSIKIAFDAFQKGFTQCMGNLSGWIGAAELQELVVGTDNLDFSELEPNTIYEGGFTKDSPTVKMFWEVVREFSGNERERFLHFVTSCSRAPIGGLKTMKLILQRNGPDTEQLPTSHTCFNLLLLPEYATKEKLKAKLLLAIQNAEGFGLK
ncbi:putative ubiquitin-protein ligase E3A [Monocercomonoides exilis]|uniref:putative ubiquitin-protein ligase E3A n=1 Tax=Monocercomonoides exilis TaxID=2049356 RepID=UPI00355A103D|nr:putative ubiquitin-protein ligase E3A [Monocercomonoides exilis]|eukprot:MONOS_5304.1-p1 / transcript=MONOS_5304.1 / gene=MONOS_5304 / organism=Monocercomonoides_exilis_PA203 / gene_product=rCG45114 / transcript_product=rCG45114 / location=Mono_scaffold00153:4636-7557(-) / protein_length=884 / sequence_SO=supercontig / SO=protein_coding / is_pseudo=false